MNTILAYTQHPKLTRAAFLAELQWHQDQDKIVKGTYWQDGRGCAVGCAINSISRLADKPLMHSDHTSLTEMLGIPLELARLEDAIFEGLPSSEARTWPMRFSSAIQQGADLSGVWPQFAAWMLREIALPAVSDEFPTVRAVIKTVIRGMETGWVDMDRAAAEAAARATAEAAARATAEAAARAAAEAAARGAAWATAEAAAGGAAGAAAGGAAGAAAWATAEAAAWATAGAAAWATAEADAYHRMAERLLTLLAAAPVAEDVV